MYVDNRYEGVSYESIPSIGKPLPVSMEVEYFVNGTLAPKATEAFRPKIVRILRSTGVFTEANSADEAFGGRVSVKLSEQHGFWDALRKARRHAMSDEVSLTGQYITADVDITITYMPPDGDPLVKDYKRSAYLVLGWHSAPPNAAKVPPFELADRTLEDPILCFVSDEQMATEIATVADALNGARLRRLPSLAAVNVASAEADSEVIPASNQQATVTARIPNATHEPLLR